MRKFHYHTVYYYIQISIRDVLISDAGQIAIIYNYYVETSTCTFDTESLNTNDIEGKIKNNNGFPWLVYEENNKILGYVHLSKFKERKAYGNTSELSIYVNKDYSRKGIGSKLMINIIQTPIKLGITNIISALALPNSESLNLHRKMGFNRNGVLHNVGHKFGRTIDVMYLQLLVDPSMID